MGDEALTFIIYIPFSYFLFPFYLVCCFRYWTGQCSTGAMHRDKLFESLRDGEEYAQCKCIVNHSTFYDTFPQPPNPYARTHVRNAHLHVDPHAQCTVLFRRFTNAFLTMHIARPLHVQFKRSSSQRSRKVLLRLPKNVHSRRIEGHIQRCAVS